MSWAAGVHVIISLCDVVLYENDDGHDAATHTSPPSREAAAEEKKQKKPVAAGLRFCAENFFGPLAGGAIRW